MPRPFAVCSMQVPERKQKSLGATTASYHFSNSSAGFTAVRLKVEENQLVDVFGEIGVRIDGLKGA